MPPILRRSPSGPNADAHYPAPGGGLLRVPAGGGYPEAISGEQSEDIWYWSASQGLWTTSAPRPARTWDNAYSPVGNWPLDGIDTAAGEHRLTDISGNGFDLSVETGTEQFSMLGYGLQGFFFDGATNLVRSPATPELLIPGAMTVMMLVVGVDELPAINGYLVSHGNSGELQVDNTVYALGQSSANRTWFSFQEHDAGINDGTPIQTYFSAGTQIHQIGYRKTAPSGGQQQVQLFLDGHKWGGTATITATNGGSSGRLRFGREVLTNFWTGTMASAVIWDRALTDAQLLERYNYALGRIYGYRSSFLGPLT